MTIISLTDCCRLLPIDPKTLRRWLALGQFTLAPHPTDARLKGVTGDHLRMLADRLAEGQGEVEVEVIEGIGHFGPLEDHDRVALSVIEHLVR